MSRFEYAVIPAPQRGEKAPGAKTASDRFCLTLEQALNQMGAQGWDYVRAETLPSEERSGLTSRTTVWNNVLIFRRAVVVAEPVPEPAPAAAPIPAPVTAEPPAPPAAEPEPAPTPAPVRPNPAPPSISETP